MNKFLKLFIDDVEENLEPNEQIILQNGANLFRDIAIGGQLTLTSHRLIFKAHKFNFDTKPESIKLEDVKGVKKVKTLNFFDTSLRVTTEDDSEYKFVLSAHTRDKWFETIDEMLSQVTTIS